MGSQKIEDLRTIENQDTKCVIGGQIGGNSRDSSRNSMAWPLCRKGKPMDKAAQGAGK